MGGTERVKWGLSFGGMLKAARRARGLTTTLVAARAGRNQGYLSSIERDKSLPSEEFLRSVAPYYGCPWWGPRRNLSWWLSVAQVYEALPVRSVGRQAAIIEDSVNNAHRIIETLNHAISKDADIRVMLDELGERLYLPGIKKMSVNETLPMWAWINSSLDVDIYDKNVGSTPVETAGAILAYVDVTLRHVAVEVDAAVLGQRIKELRESKGWSAESLTRAVNDVRTLQKQPLLPILETADIAEIERGAGPLTLAAVEALAKALDVPPSAVLSDAPRPTPVNLEEEIWETLREYGLSEEAVTNIVALIAFWRARELDD